MSIWLSLDHAQREHLIFLLSKEKGALLDFWRAMSFTSKQTFLSDSEHDKDSLIDLFKSMPLENKAGMISMLDDKVAKEFLDTLPESEQNEFILHQSFGL